MTTGKGVVLTSGGGREEELGKEELWRGGLGVGTGLLGGKKVGDRVAVEGGGWVTCRQDNLQDRGETAASPGTLGNLNLPHRIFLESLQVEMEMRRIISS